MQQDEILFVKKQRGTEETGYKVTEDIGYKQAGEYALEK